MSHIIGTKQNFQSEVLESTGKVLVDFWAEWCGPCKMLSPLLDEISEENKDLKIVKVDADAEDQLANEYNINSLPTVLVFSDGQLIKTIVGFRQKSEYLNALK